MGYVTGDDYQGWTNAATWAAALWIGNDYGSYQHATDLAENAPNILSLARKLARDFRGANTKAATWAKGPVNWAEIAQAYWEERSEQ